MLELIITKISKSQVAFRDLTFLIIRIYNMIIRIANVYRRVKKDVKEVTFARTTTDKEGTGGYNYNINS